VLALLAYPLKAAERVGIHLDLDATLALAIPFVLLAVWGVVREIRRRFRDHPYRGADGRASLRYSSFGATQNRSSWIASFAKPDAERMSLPASIIPGCPQR